MQRPAQLMTNLAIKRNRSTSLIAVRRMRACRIHRHQPGVRAPTDRGRDTDVR
jgi:hypothetical protein